MLASVSVLYTRFFSPSFSVGVLKGVSGDAQRGRNN